MVVYPDVYSAHRLPSKVVTLLKKYGLTISVQKTKSMEFKGRDPVRTKIVIKKIIEQIRLTI